MSQTFMLAAVISEAVTKLIPGLSCDLASLMVEAQTAETHINSIIKNRNQSKLPYYLIVQLLPAV